MTQDWPGRGAPRAEQFLCAADIADGDDLLGPVGYLFACNSAGTPDLDYFRTDLTLPPSRIADRAFVAALPQRLLQQGALAIIGHVERAWAVSFLPAGVGPQLVPFRNTLRRIMGGECLGHALVDFTDRCRDLSAELLGELNDRSAAGSSDQQLVLDWLERNDARSYILPGDPAAKLKFS